MTNLDTELLGFIAKLHHAMPDSTLWNGQAARACANELQKIIGQLQQLRANLIELPWVG